MEPLVSIITPAFNASKYLVSFFESVLDQEYSNYELIFINDGSTDDTEEIALQYKKIFEEKGHRFVYLVKENGGQAAALNTGFPYMKGKYFIWPDSDDTLCSDNLSVKVDFMEKNPSIDLGIAWAIHVDESGNDLGVLKRIPAENDNLFRDLLVSNNVQFCPYILLELPLSKSVTLSCILMRVEPGKIISFFFLWRISIVTVILIEFCIHISCILPVTQISSRMMSKPRWNVLRDKSIFC